MAAFNLLGRLVLASMLLPLPAAAQAATPCEIHVWPATTMNTVTSGWVWNNVEDSGFANKGERLVPRNGPLDGPGQTAIMADVDLAHLFGLAAATVIRHDEAPPPRPSGEPVVRRVATEAPCYAELEVTKLFYGRAVMAGSSLQILFTYRLFGTGPEPERTFSTFANEPLLIFPAKQPSLTAEANAELVAAFRKGVVDFAGYATRPVKQHHASSDATHNR